MGIKDIKSGETKKGKGSEQHLSLAEIRRITQAIDVMEYVDYRLYVHDIYHAIKAVHSQYSYLQFSHDLGFPKTNFIWQVVNHKRGFTPKATQVFIDALDLRLAKRRFLITLRDHNHARRPQERSQLFAELTRIRRESVDDQSSGQYLDYFSEWYHPVVRELAGRADFQGDPHWICEQVSFPLMPKEAQESLDLLVRLGLLRVDPKTGRYEQTANQVTPERKVDKLAGVKYHQDLCNMARESITFLANERRDLNGMTVRLDEGAMHAARAILQQACEAIMALEQHTPNGDQVVQFNLQMFAYTKRRAS